MLAMLLNYKDYCKRIHKNKAIIKIARHLLTRIDYVLRRWTPYVCGLLAGIELYAFLRHCSPDCFVLYSSKKRSFNCNDVHYHIEQMVAEGDLVAINTTVTGTAKSEMFALPAGQKKSSFQANAFLQA